MVLQVVARRPAGPVALGDDARVEHEHGGLLVLEHAEVDEHGLVAGRQRLEALDVLARGPRVTARAEAHGQLVELVGLLLGRGLRDHRDAGYRRRRAAHGGRLGRLGRLRAPAAVDFATSGFGVGVGVASGLKGSLREPSTRRRPLRSPSAARATIGSVASTACLSLLTATAGAAAGGGGSSRQQHGHGGSRGDQKDRHRPQPALHEEAPGVVDHAHRVAPEIVAVVVVAGALCCGVPDGAGAAPPAAVGPSGVAPAVRPSVGGSR